MFSNSKKHPGKENKQKREYQHQSFFFFLMLLLFYDYLWDGKELHASSSADSMNENYLIFNISKLPQSV